MKQSHLTLAALPDQAQPGSRAFTMIELLVVLAIVGVLASLSMTVYGKVQQSARKADEANVARNLIAAYLTAANDYNGRFLPGYDRQVGEVQLPDGDTVSGPAANRYPYRLLPYLGGGIEGNYVLDANAPDVDLTEPYSISLYPAFGINYLYVGGDVATSGEVTIASECLRRNVGSHSILAFASSGTGGGDDEVIHGFNILTPPRIYGEMWSNEGWSAEAEPGNYGNVDFRHGSRAVCAFLDGSVKFQTAAELRDMRHWSIGAAETNDPDYTVARQQRGGRGGR